MPTEITRTGGVRLPVGWKVAHASLRLVAGREGLGARRGRFYDQPMVGSAPIVERDDRRVMFRRTTDEQEAITRTWAEVERAIGSLRGRKFYGVFDTTTNEYRVCVQWREGDDAAALGLEDGSFRAAGISASG